MFCPCCGKSITPKKFSDVSNIFMVTCENKTCNAYDVTGELKDYTKFLSNQWELEILFDQETGKKI